MSKPLAMNMYAQNASGVWVPVSPSNPLPGTSTPISSTAGTQTNVAGSASSVTILAANTNRKGFMVYNDSTATLYLGFATPASTSAYAVQIPGNGFFEFPTSPTYTGAVYGIWSAANGNARVTEFT